MFWLQTLELKISHNWQNLFDEDNMFIAFCVCVGTLWRDSHRAISL